MLFQTTSLIDTAYLLTKGYSLTETKRRGSLIAFTLNLDENDAEKILGHPERDLCEHFARSWRDLRRQMDRLTDGPRP